MRPRPFVCKSVHAPTGPVTVQRSTFIKPPQEKTITSKCCCLYFLIRNSRTTHYT